MKLTEAESSRIMSILVWLSDDIPHGKADRERLSEYAAEALELMRNAVRRDELKTTR